MLYRRAILVPAAALLLATAGRAQTYGTVALDPSLADAGAQVTGALVKNLQGGGLGYCEGPSSDAEGNVYFTEGNPSRIWKVTPAGQASVFEANGAYASNGTEVDPQGRIIVGQQGAVAAYTPGGARTVLQTAASDIKVNDLTIGSTGAMYYSHWGANVFYRSASGQVSPTLTFATANGVEWIEERKKLYVAQDGPDEVWVYDVAADGMLSGGKVFKAVPEPDGITADEKGNIYIASWKDGKVYVFDTSGTSLGTITVTAATGTPPGQGLTNGQEANTSNLVFGGPDRKTLYITGDGGLYKVPMKVAGRSRPGPVRLRRGGLRPDRSGLRLSRSVFDPAERGLSIGLPASEGRLAVRVYDARMREVWTSAAAGGLEWDGRDAAGGPLPSGRYYVLAGAAGGEAMAAPVDLLRR